MTFAYPLPWWLALALVAAAATVAFNVYRRPLAPLPPARRAVLIATRTMALSAILLFVFRPIVLMPPVSTREATVPVLVDVSRSMRLPDADGMSRLARVQELLQNELLPAIGKEFQPEVYSAGDRLAPADPRTLSAEAHHSDLAGALAAVRERYRGQAIPGIVVLSDGGDTGQRPMEADEGAGGPPVFAVGVGAPDGLRDREVLGITAGDPRLDQSSIDLHVSAVSFGFGRTPFQLRVLANGRLVESRRVAPPADGSPIDETLTVSPDPATPTVYTAEIPAADGEPVVENNARSVLVSPAGRKRRLLVLEGAPGFEHTFFTRALARDPGLEVDSVVRKGRNVEGLDTYLVQAGAGRTSALLNGFPATREQLYTYDAMVLANVEGDGLTRAQLGMAADFVAERGGGLLVLGGRSFGARGLIGTPLESALPVELNDRRGTVVRTSLGGREVTPDNKVVMTAEGETHPVMRVGASREETAKLWASLPPLAASATVGGPRPGATVLAVAQSAAGAVHPLVAVQRYGQGRSMIFAGEASWRWRMLASASDRTHEFFWRQAGRWLARPSPDPVAVTVPDAAEPGESIAVDVEARDAAFAPVPAASVEATLTLPGGEVRTLKLRHTQADGGRFTAGAQVERPGLYRVRASARRGTDVLGAADRWFYVGGADREFADPRLNEGFLRRAARASGGRYVRAGEAARIVSWLGEAKPSNAAPEPRDLWHTPWSFLVVAGLLSAEWTLRRRWGLR